MSMSVDNSQEPTLLADVQLAIATEDTFIHQLKLSSNKVQLFLDDYKRLKKDGQLQIKLIETLQRRHQDDQQALRQMEEYIARCTREQQFASKQAEIQRRACLENIDVLYLQEENRKIANKLDNCIEENNTLRAQLMIVREKVKESYKALVTENKAANELIETEVQTWKAQSRKNSELVTVKTRELQTVESERQYWRTKYEHLSETVEYIEAIRKAYLMNKSMNQIDLMDNCHESAIRFQDNGYRTLS